MPSLRLLLLLILPLLAAAAAAADSPTAYDLLKSYGFPSGLLPVGITSYELDSGTGKFSVSLNKTCGFSIQGYDLSYKTRISGTISKGKIRNLKGIQVKVLLFWVNIIEVTIDGEELELSVGIASADFPVDNFDESPQCGCGFDCVSKKRNWGFNLRRATGAAVYDVDTGDCVSP